jgi:sugar transferase EpsL
MAFHLFPKGIPKEKRIFDLVLTLPLIILASPFLLIISIAILMVSGKPVTFRQNRPGYLGHIFSITKFRTMNDKRDERNILLKDEDRVTRLGRFLRAYSLDELPELINVLAGEMSLVGPRPLLVKYLELYSPEQARRHLVLPGMTGWAQINGRNVLSWEERFALDIWYVDHWSLSLDVKILLLTIRKVISREAVSPPNKLTADEFTGNQQHPPI